MKTKKNYMIPAMKAVEIESLTLLAGSGTSLNAGGSIVGRGDLTDPEDDE